MMSDTKRTGPATPPSARNLTWILLSRRTATRLRVGQPRHLGQAWVHVIPWLGAHDEDVLAGPELAGVVQAAGSNRHHVCPGTRFAEETRPARAAEGPPSRVATVRLEIEAPRTPSCHPECRPGHRQDWREGTPSLSLTIPAVAIQRKERLRLAFI